MSYRQNLVDHDACGVGFVTRLDGRPSHEIVERALEALVRLEHRGGVDADGHSGDGAGLLTAIPDRFFRHRAAETGIDLPLTFAVGMIFLPPESENEARKKIEIAAQKSGLRHLGWRSVPTSPEIVGPRAQATLPVIAQCFIAPGRSGTDDWDGRLFRMRKQAEADVPEGTYLCSLSARTIVYKGLLTPKQLPSFYCDLRDPEFKTPFAIFHQRYSTNTQPSWLLAQPFRFVAHNGEINTISGNRRWLRARESKLRLGLGLPNELHLLEDGVSDSASFDNGLEVLMRRGFTSPEAMLTMVPPAWDHSAETSPEMRTFLAQQAREQEPWDGPAALVFSDGQTLGAKLDRNGLRPLRYVLCSDGLLVVGSEVGIADLQGKQVIERRRLGPGEMLLVDLCTGIFVRPQDSATLQIGARTAPSVRQAMQIGPSETAFFRSTPEPNKVMTSLGWSEDQFRLLFLPLVEQGQEAVWSMGDDTPPAALSSFRRPLWDYCKQRFAQVTNPPIDSLRESHVMSLKTFIGDYVSLTSPLLDAGQLETLKSELASVQAIDCTFSAESGVAGAEAALERIRQAARSVSANSGLILLSDRGVNAQRAALPALLALAAAWKAMVEAGACDVPLVIETGQVIDTHHVAVLIAAGASAVFPYLAFEQAQTLQPDGARRYRLAVENGLRKVIARMGISTISSYRNSQLFETVGLDPDLCEEFFEDAGHALGGKGLEKLLQDCLDRHSAAFTSEHNQLHDIGLYRFRQKGERHAASPELVRRMHRYIKSPTAENYQAFVELGYQRDSLAVRDLLDIAPADPVPVPHVESESSILRRFSTQAMSLGAVSRETHRTLAIAMNRLGGRSNTGEGGEDPDNYSDGAEANNRVKQLASARFGVTAEYLVHADELEIKIAQGAKPGEGGQLPASKVSAYIARLRHAVPNMMLISPPPHHDIYSIEDLAQLIYDLRAINPHARIGVKLVASTGVGIIATGVAKAGADVITISGHDGGTGASPITSIKNTGLPWEYGLGDAHGSLLKSGLRGRVRLRVDGGFKFARDVIFGALFGADEFGFGTAALLALGCVMARRCHLNTCPVGIATQDEALRARFAGKPEMIETYFRALATEVRELLAAMGARSLDEIVGAVERLRPRSLDAEQFLGEILPSTDSRTAEDYPQKGSQPFATDLRKSGEVASLHVQVAEKFAEPRAAKNGHRRFAISNCDRAIGAHLSGEIMRRDRVHPGSSQQKYEFDGTAGQSFGAFLISGLQFRLFGEANDYVGKGLCGGTIAITAGEEASSRGDVLAGNTVLYGATGGELYIAGRAGERFAVRNSGALAVAEGVGQHGCEYMTAGIAVILGPAGSNFGAGMTGGLAYLLQDSIGQNGYNRQSVRLESLEAGEELWLRRILRKHLGLTGSPRAAHWLKAELPLPFQRVEPIQRPCAVTQTWAPILANLMKQQISLPMPPERIESDRMPVMFTEKSLPQRVMRAEA